MTIRTGHVPFWWGVGVMPEDPARRDEPADDDGTNRDYHYAIGFN